MTGSSAKLRRASVVQCPLAAVICVLALPGLVTSACPPNYSEVYGSCFLVLADSSVPFIDAKTVCQYYGGDVALVEDCTLLGELSTFLTVNYPGLSRGLWVGGSDLASEGTWLWTDGSEVPLGPPYWGRADYADWHLEPSGGSAQNCLVLGSLDGYFHDQTCDHYPGVSPLCQVDPIDGLCPGSYVSVLGRCFQFLSDVDVTSSDGRSICQDKGGDLAIIDDCHLLAKVVDYAQQIGSVPDIGYWLAGSDSAVEGVWGWWTGAPVPMGAPYWGMDGSGPMEPDNDGGQDCMLLSSLERFYFNDVDCGSQATVLCQTDPIEEPSLKSLH